MKNQRNLGLTVQDIELLYPKIIAELREGHNTWRSTDEVIGDHERIYAGRVIETKEVNYGL